jgi:UDP-glucose 4-epimerase
MLGIYESIRSGKRPIIEGDGTQVTDYLYAGDAARANLMAMASAASGTGMNIVSGVDTSQNRVVELVLKACQSGLEPEYHTDPDKLLMPVETKLSFSRARAKELIGWEPQVPIDDGIVRLVAWLDRHRRPT